MLTLIAIVSVGFVLGMRHATDADHVVAVTTIVSRERSLRLAAWLGALWGLGHTVTIVIVGGGIILFNVVIPPRVGLLMELSVSVMLIVLGVWNLRGTWRALAGMFRLRQPSASHPHVHAHGDYVHSHPHPHDRAPHPHRPDETPLAKLDRSFRRLKTYQIVRPIVVGVVHGLAGSAAVALLVLTTIQNPAWALIYLLVFGGGTVGGMVLVTMALAAPFAFTHRHVAITRSRLQAATGLLSVGFGLFLAYQIGYVDGLFTSAPHWTPQ